MNVVQLNGFRTWLISSMFIGVLAVPVAGMAEDDKPDAAELMEKQDQRHRVDHLQIQGKFVLQKEGGAKRTRKVDVKWEQNDKTGDKVRIEFTAPSNVDGLTVLTVENKAGGDDKQWVYLPGFDSVRRIGVADLGDRFAGTDFYYEDFKRRYPDEYTYKILGEDEFDGHACWVIQRKPAGEEVKKESPYQKTKLWLRKDILFAVKELYFDKRGQPLKKITFDDLVNVQQKAWRAKETVATDVQRKHRTTFYQEFTVREDFGEKVFSNHVLGE